MPCIPHITATLRKCPLPQWPHLLQEILSAGTLDDEELPFGGDIPGPKAKKGSIGAEGEGGVEAETPSEAGGGEEGTTAGEGEGGVVNTESPAAAEGGLTGAEGPSAASSSSSTEVGAVNPHVMGCDVAHATSSHPLHTSAQVF